MIKEVSDRNHKTAFLIGKLLLKNELNLTDREIDQLLREKKLEMIPAILFRGHQQRPICGRCHNQDIFQFGQHPCAKCGSPSCYYCRHCLSLGKVQACQGLYRWIGSKPKQTKELNALAWDGELSLGQSRASAQIVSWLEQKKTGLVWAVCGAGKTEIIFKGLESAFAKGWRVLLATPRTDVVKELEPRFRQAFPSIRMAALYGGSEHKDLCHMFILATTHQVLRYENAFDCIIVDEVDAFPFSFDKSLQFAVERAKKEGAPIIYLSATPNQKLLRQSSLQIVKIPKRFHGYPLPVPSLKWVGDWTKKLKKKKLPSPLIRWLTEHLTQPILLFVPTISVLEQLSDALSVNGFSHGKVYADARDRHQTVKAFREGAISLLVTTTILERGVTISNVAVAVLGAENPVFDEAALVQIAGRVGRDRAFPEGAICFFHFGKTLAINRAIRQVKMMNREGALL